MGVTKVQMVEEITKTDRRTRSPRHSFNIRQKPFAIVPFMIAPVLPGETLTNWFCEARLVSDPIANSRIGWKHHMFFFYVKATDLLQNAIRDMFADPANVDLSSSMGIASASQAYYTAKGGVPYAEMAVKRIVETYFRDKGEAWNHATITGEGGAMYPAAQIKEGFWMDSLTDKDLVPQGAAISTAANAGDLERLMLAFEQLRALGLANMDYEDYLRAAGITVQDEDVDRPELLATFSEFMYPSNTVNPTDGSAVAALSTVLKKGDSARKFFKEPGFIVGLSVLRPKVYFGGLAGNLSAHLSRSWDWLPGWNNDTPQTSLKRFTKDTGPLGERNTDTDDYFVDMRDLFIHGDQWHNMRGFDSGMGTQAADHIVNLPDQNLNWKYPPDVLVNQFFREPTTVNRQFTRLDGYASFNIRGHQRDYTVGNIASV